MTDDRHEEINYRFNVQHSIGSYSSSSNSKSTVHRLTGSAAYLFRIVFSNSMPMLRISSVCSLHIVLDMAELRHDAT